ncbi:hypothetical protein B5X24_HaOG204166 [Helicoverpa armigera]|uniref:Uncharacterized protein n=1 Tax=Helicoverpa armigera TaxID=29058 RepID=A0A2W1BNT2_HELAM|nr:hypothetical protein B5X24_HaOG204166 [Helicoverpa armigera]
MGRQSDTTGKRSGAGPTFTCSPMHGCINHQLPGSGLLCESLLKPTKRFRPDSGIELETSCSHTHTHTHKHTVFFSFPSVQFHKSQGHASCPSPNNHHMYN